jgi:hypothetical protein
MRHGQFRHGDPGCTVKDDVDVDRSRGPPSDPTPAKMILDRQATAQQLNRKQLRNKFGDEV